MNYNRLKRPLLQSEIEHAHRFTTSGHEAARYLNVNYTTYKKYATLYGLFEQHKNPSGKGRTRHRIRGAFGLDSIFRGEHPGYDRTKLKERMIRAGYLVEKCAICNFSERRVLDGRCPLNLISIDGDNTNLSRENLELRCFNCTFLTTGRVRIIDVVPVTHHHIYDMDLEHVGVTPDDIEELRRQARQELSDT